MMVITKDVVVQRTTRGGGVNVTGLSGKDAVKTNEIYNNMIEKKSIATSMLQDPQLLKSLGKTMLPYIKDWPADYKAKQNCFAKLSEAVELLQNERSSKVLQGLKVVDDVLMIASGYFGNWAEADAYLVNDKASAELKQIVRELYVKHELIAAKANKILERAGKEPLDYNCIKKNWSYCGAVDFKKSMENLQVKKRDIRIVTLASGALDNLQIAVKETSADIPLN